MSRRALAALTVTFLLAHAPSLPQSLEDIDSVNFALGVRDFDIARHRPHPPGYPVYIGAAKTAVAAARLFSGSGDDAQSAHESSRVEARAMAVLSLAGALVAIVCLYRLFCCFAPASQDRLGRPWREFDPRALAATALAAACPLFWYMSVRPMSDVPGLAAALTALVCLALAWWRQQPISPGDRRLDAAHLGASGRMIVLGSLLAAFSVGFRSQNAMLTLPFLLFVLIDRIGRGVAGALIGATVALAVGALVWTVPLVAASGGVGAYLGALGAQAGEDFAGVEMLYLNPSPRVAANALLRTMVYPWDSLALGTTVLVLAAVGAGALLVRDRRTLAALIAIGVPYLIFHLLFHDMDFVRYALPIVPVVAFLVVCGLETIARRGALPVSGALALWSVVVASPTLFAYSTEPSPITRALGAMRAENAPPSVVLALHQTFQRPLEAESIPLARQLPSPPRREWLELVRHWRDESNAPVWFLADPRRTDLALIDPRSRGDRRDFAWHFSSLSDIGGMRPAGVEWYRLAPPGWFAGEGWALTPETAGIARATNRGPHLGPIRAWVRRRAEPARMLIGGRHLGGPQDAPVTFTVTLDGNVLAQREVRPGFFLHVIDVPAGALEGPGALTQLDVESSAVGESGIATAIEQFDLQTAGSLMWGFDDGWHEAEYNPRIGLWRWTSERAAFRIVDAAGPVRLRIQIESPSRYFSRAPTVRVMVAGQVLAEVRPTGDTILDALVPLAALRDANGRVTVETDQVFVPADRGGASDLRHLGLRVFGVSVAVPN